MINGSFENQHHDTQFSNDKGADAKALSTEKKKTSKFSPSVGGKRVKKEVTYKGLLVLKISFYLVSPNSSSYAAQPVGRALA